MELTLQQASLHSCTWWWSQGSQEAEGRADTSVYIAMLLCYWPKLVTWQSSELFVGGRLQKGVGNAAVCITQLTPSLQMSPPPSGFVERSGGGGGGPLSHFYSGSPTSYFTSGLQAGLKQSHLNKVRHLPSWPQVPRDSQGAGGPCDLNHSWGGGRGQLC